jgi:protocatechuate 3,4-dioxygenase, alpha subunit
MCRWTPRSATRSSPRRAATRIYFPDEEAANAADPVLEAVPAGRRATLIAQPAGENYLRFDIIMQGAGETVFFQL